MRTHFAGRRIRLYYIESKNKGAKRWRPHIPGHNRREDAEARLDELRFHGRLNPTREYRISEAR